MAVQTHTLVFQFGLFELGDYLATSDAVEAWEPDTDLTNGTVLSTDYSLVAKRIEVVVELETEF